MALLSDYTLKMIVKKATVFILDIQRFSTII